MVISFVEAVEVVVVDVIDGAVGVVGDGEGKIFCSLFIDGRSRDLGFMKPAFCASASVKDFNTGAP